MNSNQQQKTDLESANTNQQQKISYLNQVCKSVTAVKISNESRLKTNKLATATQV